DAGIDDVLKIREDRREAFALLGWSGWKLRLHLARSGERNHPLVADALEIAGHPVGHLVSLLAERSHGRGTLVRKPGSGKRVEAAPTRPAVPVPGSRFPIPPDR